MAKKKKKIEESNSEPVANSSQSEAAKPSGDRFKEVVEKRDLSEEGELMLSQYDIEKLIVTVRGEQVLIDRDLAMIYGIETKRLNEQVKRNIARFPERYRFQLTKDEMMELVANCDRFKTLKHSTTTPYAFTEFGVSMLPSALSNPCALVADKTRKGRFGHHSLTLYKRLPDRFGETQYTIRRGEVRAAATQEP